MENSKIAIFQKKEIRKTIHNNKWWFSVVDICSALTGSSDAGVYWRKLKQRLNLEGSEVVTNCHGLKLDAKDGGKIAGDAKKALEKKTKRKVATKNNYLQNPQNTKSIGS